MNLVSVPSTQVSKSNQLLAFFPCPRPAEIADIVIPWLGLPSCIHLLILYTSHEGLLRQCFSIPLLAPIRASFHWKTSSARMGSVVAFEHGIGMSPPLVCIPKTSRCWCSHLQVTSSLISGRGISCPHRASNEASFPSPGISRIGEAWIILNPDISGSTIFSIARMFPCLASSPLRTSHVTFLQFHIFPGGFDWVVCPFG